MIETLYQLNALDTVHAFLVAGFIGFLFGFFLEKAGFGSSKKLSGIFYLRDMSVVQVMFTALITAMLGLNIFTSFGLIELSTDIYLIPTYYGTAIIGGLIFGIGFAISGWCPGTSVVGFASGKIDAAIFIVGAVLGSILYNEVYPFIKVFSVWRQSAQDTFDQLGVAFLNISLGISTAMFAFFLTLIGLGLFWLIEFSENKKSENPRTPNIAQFGFEIREAFSFKPLKILSIAFIVISLGLLILNSFKNKSGIPEISKEDTALLMNIENGKDHISPEELADALLKKVEKPLVIDVRSSEEYEAFHIRGAINIALHDLPKFMAGQPSEKKVVLYSNGMVHPAQARDIFFKIGYKNIFILTDGLDGFIETCLKPASLRAYHLTNRDISRIKKWRAYFLNYNLY